MKIEDYLIEKKWPIVHRQIIPERSGVYYPVEKLQSVLSEPVFRYLEQFKRGLYQHQHQAISHFMEGHNVCLSTPTASGKSLVFYSCAIEKLVQNPTARILAIYPLKALGSEQQNRWEAAIEKAGLPVSVGRIDGGVSPISRPEILEQHRILIMTPDIIHAWLLSNLNNPAVINFIKEIALIIVDEAHIYSGVFGSNSAFLFRRLNHLISRLNQLPTYIAASATMKNPQIHLKKLIGSDFQIIREAFNSIPQKKIQIIMVDPPETGKIMTAFPELMNFIAEKTEHQFITFVDSRKQTEVLASVGAQQWIDTKRAETPSVDDLDVHSLQNLKIVPYRSGYEEHDRVKIQEKLSNGELKGVISTSALEMGIDIPHLTLGLLYGIPNSATSFFQRIGRIGRHQSGMIIIINNRSVFTKNLFRNPHELMNIPLSESTLYLENSRIQYIHALCLARKNGEDDQVNKYLGSPATQFQTEIDFPPGFNRLCQAERTGKIGLEMQLMKAQAREKPNYAYPIRDVDSQFQVEMKMPPQVRRLGMITYEQMLREAYPGAIYYYQTQCFRVHQINVYRKIITVKREKRYSTKPNVLPTLIFPNLTKNTVYNFIRYGELILVECDLQIREAISGYTEKRGPNELKVDYPLPNYNRKRFARNFFTTGILFYHPAIEPGWYNRFVLSQIVLDAFLLTLPFDSKDLAAGTDKFRVSQGIFAMEDHFFSIYDQTYGSLRLSTRLLEPPVITTVFDRALEIARNDTTYPIEPAIIKNLQEIRQALKHPAQDMQWMGPQEMFSDNLIRVILPGSSGLNLKHGNDQFFIDAVVMQAKGLVYEGNYDSSSEKPTNPSSHFSPPKFIVPAEYIVEIPGESKMGSYNRATGEILPD